MKTWVESRKQLKRNHILDLIRRSPDPLSRYDLKKMTGYSMTTVSNNVSELIEDQLVTEDACADSGRMGRKPVFLHLNPAGGCFIGIEFNIEALHYVVLDFTCTPLFSGEEDICEPVSADGILKLIFRKTQACLDELHRRGVPSGRVLGIGLGLPGYLDAGTGVALSYPYLADWVNIPIVQMMEERFHLPCHIGNNVGVMGLVFKWIGAYRADEDFLLISIRSGVRCIPVLNQEPYSGRISTTGEIGHLKVSSGTRVCDCGATGCLNTEIADFSIRAIVEEGFAQGRYQAVRALCGPGRPNVSLLVRAARAGDAESQALIARSARFLGTAVAEAANLFAPQKVILSGRLVQAGELFMDPLRRRVVKNCLPAVNSHMEILASPFGDGIGALGAATLTLEREFNPLVQRSAL